MSKAVEKYAEQRAEGARLNGVNSAVYAMQVLQREMEKDVEQAGLYSEDDVMALVKELRDEDEKG